MADHMSFLLFGDQSLDTHGFLADFFRAGHPGVLAREFLRQVGDALRDEIDALPPIERASIPVFRTLQQLNEKYHAQSSKVPGVDSALLCVAQLAHYIDLSEKQHEDATTAENRILSGLCTGLFAASAIASSPSLSTLLPVAVQVVLMAFRTGNHVASMAERLSPATKSMESWTYVLPGVKESEARSSLDEFHKDEGITSATQVYISAISGSNVALSGPPATLKLLFSKDLFESRPTAIPVYGPYHAPHLHKSTDIRRLLRLDDKATEAALAGSRPQSKVVSCVTGIPFAQRETAQLIAAVVGEILNAPLHFQQALNGCIESAKGFGGKRAVIIPCGPTQAASTFAKALASQTSLKVELREPPQVARHTGAASIGNHGSLGRCKLAIVGMAGRFPDSESHEALWDLLEKGIDAHRVVPADRFPHETHVDPTGKSINTSHTPYGNWIKNPGHFDPRFFNMSPREAYQTDPMQRMALTTAYEALEMSGYVPNRTPSTRLDRIGTFYGQTSDDWREINAAQEVDTYFITGGVRAFGPGRINYHFGFSGPSFSVDTACSSSAAAMNIACSSLWNKDCDTAIVGGLSCMTNSDIFSGLSRGQFLSKSHNCNTFDNDADGYCRADACASIIVKRLDDALADQDNILAVVLGTQTNHSADAVSITHPHGPTQSILSSSILDEAGVDPLDVDYVEMHGTGTQAGDGTEMKSVTDVFAPRDRLRPADRPLYLGAVKSNIGHGEAASGITALVKVLMMLKKNAIPPHIGIKKEINKTFPTDLGARGVNIAFHKTPFARKDGKARRVFVNNFSAAGGNTGLLLEDGPKSRAASIDPRTHHVVTVTAKSKGAMIRNAENLLRYIDENPHTSVSNLAYTTTARRIQHYWRMSVSATSLMEAKEAIQERLKSAFVPVPPEQPQIAFMFTGQGSHYAGLGKDLYSHHSVFRTAIDDFDHLAQIHGFSSFLPLIDGSEQDIQKLSPVIVQLGLASFEMAMAKLWASWGIKPSVVLGHSLGEYAALHVAGVLSASDTIYLVGARAQLLVEKCTAGTHAMLAVQGSVDTVTEALGARAENTNIACINGPRETVLSGTADEVAEISSLLSGAGFKCTQLRVPFAFHSAQVEAILDDFESLARSVHFQPAQVPIISPLLGKLVEEELIDASYLRRHARDAVNFLGGLVSAQQASVIDDRTVWLEVGPHPVCANMVKAAFGATTLAIPTLRRNEAAYKTLSNTLCTLHSAGVNFDWNEFHRDFAASVRLLDLPAYAFDLKNYWLQYTGDWCLTKNRGALPATNLKAIEPAKPKLSTTSVQRIVKEEINGDIAILETESEMTEENLRKVCSGHMVNGTALTPSSLYGDMAMTISEYAYKLLRPDAGDVGVNVAHMECPKSLIFNPKADSQILRMRAKVNAASSSAEITWTTGEGAKLVEHALCKVSIGKRQDWLSEFERVGYLIKSRIDALHAAEDRGEASKVGRGLAYKLFSALVDYDRRYRGMESVILLSDTCEATAKVVFQTSPEDGSFRCAPYWIDSLCHISGFILNGTDAVDSREQVFISHGWGSMRFAEDFSVSKTYRTYIRMQPVKDSKMMSGDAYIFDGDRLVGMTGDIRFQAIPRKVLNIVLPPQGSAAVGAVTSAPTRAAQLATKPVQQRRESAKEKKQVTSSNLKAVNKTLVKSSVVEQVMEIISKETGVGHDELDDNIAFADLGVDSLMGLTISGRLREELELNIDSHAFLEHATIGLFKKFLAQFDSTISSSPMSSGASGQSDSDEEEDIEECDSNITTPLEDSDEGSVKCDPVDAIAGNSELRQIVRETICAEMGVDVEEIVAAPDLAALGMDSLMSLSILGILREKTGLSIPSDLLGHNPSLKDIERTLGIEDKPPRRAAPAPAAGLSKVQVKVQSQSTVKIVATIPPAKDASSWGDAYELRKASSVLMSGNHRTAKKQLFMVPDGSGSATSYTEIADLGPDVAVWGMFSPFMRTPHEYKCGVYGMATKFIEEMKRRQPQGPYAVAGWSAGGVIAFEMVNQLTKANEEVSHLIIIDAPSPNTIEPLPAGLHAWFASIGLLGEGDSPTAKKIPEWLLPHFAASVTALSNYTAEPIAKDKCPQVLSIWCEDGVCKEPTDPRPDPYPTGHALFLLDNRTDFGPNRWDEYLDLKKMTFRHMPGNHFSMMHGKPAKKLNEFLKEGF
ncbi:polyketide synthase [Microdochium trichocladiopsis]|uniref:Polyketide synthase n=1 Tax=Microdochium trichocladiopsis TaxID=1682393 RepID=A0A9P9BQV1_9PEZI|nr:polyketide synthase [Microdochium trichocladiopsis]KAH7026262.1 polyketide synthase [Microdochium trichocladiopsis]